MSLPGTCGCRALSPRGESHPAKLDSSQPVGWVGVLCNPDTMQAFPHFWESFNPTGQACWAGTSDSADRLRAPWPLTRVFLYMCHKVQEDKPQANPGCWTKVCFRNLSLWDAESSPILPPGLGQGVGDTEKRGAGVALSSLLSWPFFLPGPS